MSLYLRQTDTQSDLQKQISKDLQEKAKKKALEADRPDGVTDSAYIKNTKQTTTLAWVWGLVALAAVGVIVWLFVASM